MNVTVKTFAQLREITQEGSFTLTLPDNTTTMADVIVLLKKRSDKWAQALGVSDDSISAEDGKCGESGAVNTGTSSSVLMARNQQLCDIQTHVQSGDELAFFPPVTGG